MTSNISAAMRKVDPERLKENFLSLAAISSPSRREAAVSAWIRDRFSSLEPEFIEDSAAEITGSDCGNLIVRLEGDRDAPPVMLNAHMDTVEPAEGVEPVFDAGVFRSAGDTVLGADDKAAIVMMLEAITAMRQARVKLPPLDLVFTVCEEIGLLGAKALDAGLIRAEAGYALDSTEPFQLITRAPQAIRFKVDVHGKAAHAGIEPEKGVNAILLAARAMKDIPCGRIDPETTCNIGIVRGGIATNIVPDLVEIEGEVRSHDPERLKAVQDSVLGAFHRAVLDEQRGEGVRVVTRVDEDYPSMDIPCDHRLVTVAKEAAASMGRQIDVAATGGGSDANIFNGKGIATAILGIGMREVHSTSEYIRLDDMVETSRLLVGILASWPGR